VSAGAEAIVLAAFLAFCRIGGCFLVMPGLASVRVAPQIRLFLAIAVTAALLVHLWDTILPYASRRPDALLLLIVSETLTGAMIGLLARLYMLALQYIGTSMAMLMGFGGVSGQAIEEPEAQAALTSLVTFSALLLLFLLDFHHEIVKALVASYRIAPPETLFNPRGALVDLTDTLSEAFFVVIRLGSPFIAYAILVNLSIGFVNKLAPQIPIYFISLPFVIFGGLLLFYFGSNVFLSLFADGFLPTTIAR
jgi:flagellar biosynthetic protein FliR